MKKIYSKMTTNRKKFFQIETYMVIDNGKKQVYKRALNDFSKAHVNAIYTHYAKCNMKERLCKTEKIEDGIVQFEFIKGLSLEDELVDCLARRDKASFEEKLSLYKNMMCSAGYCCDRPIEENQNCIDVFGIGMWSFAGRYATGLNIDACFDNIIHAREGYVEIDFEWIFDFTLPVNFVIYRAIWALYIKNNNVMAPIYSWRELYEFFDMTKVEVLQYEKMNQHFNEYVYDGKNGYNSISKQYIKNTISIDRKTEKKQDFLQIFADFGEGYSEQWSKKDNIQTMDVVSIFVVTEYCNAEKIRLDPSNNMFLCSDLFIEVEDKFGNRYHVDEYESNSYAMADNLIAFMSNDAQIIFKNEWKTRLEKVKISFHILKYLQPDEAEILIQIKKREERYENELERLVYIKHELESRLMEVLNEIDINNEDRYGK